MQKTYLIKDSNVRQVELGSVTYKPITRQTGSIAGPFGTIPISTPTGKVDKSYLYLLSYGHGYTVRANHDDIKRKIRRLRPEEAAQLDTLDEEMSVLRERRVELLKTAWQRAHTVTIKELTEKIK